jgi:hypothetical protein
VAIGGLTHVITPSFLRKQESSVVDAA